ncbi:hypothetical protein [Bradyrhizobium sp. CB2312]|nr:hypothetical protein [Bradyrhizobium sp. CB2312]WFU70952.1 hypothetical protein QA642_37700 [Bradyrhizobium sp. CB2312]
MLRERHGRAKMFAAWFWLKLVKCAPPGHSLSRSLIRAGLRTFVLVLALSPTAALAGGTCLLHPEPFKLQSDTVRWSIKIASGGQCIQGLRWSTIMIDHIAITEMPKSGQIIIQGPSFRYLSNQGARGSDSFKLSITGSSMRISGNSSIEVEVSAE